jgi:hypothetical protein
LGLGELVTSADLIPVIKVAMARTDEVFGTRNAGLVRSNRAELEGDPLIDDHDDAGVGGPPLHLYRFSAGHRPLELRRSTRPAAAA